MQSTRTWGPIKDFQAVEGIGFGEAWMQASLRLQVSSLRGSEPGQPRHRQPPDLCIERVNQAEG
jgi:hypothetical protein